MRKRMKWLCMLAMTGVLFCTMSETKVQAATLTPTVTDNNNNHEYSWNWDDVTDAYLTPNSDGSFTRVESNGNNVIVEDYNSNFTITSQKTISMELGIFGGYYSRSSYNYIVFGQDNSSESSSTEVIRIVKYTKDWERCGSASLSGANTKVPFDGGSLEMSECNGYLYIRTCHTMFQEKDGYNHQASMTLEVNTKDMTICDSAYGISNVGTGYTSHSFDQEIDTTDGVLTAVDLGDAYPRSIVLMKYEKAAGNSTFTGTVNYVSLLDIGGEEGDNATGVCLGGYEVSSTNYLVAYSSVDQKNTSNQSNRNASRNIYMASLSRSGEFTSKNVETKAITSYTGTTKAENPYLVKIDTDKYLLMWQVGTKIQYVSLDGTGSMTGEICSMDGTFSECEPVYSNKKVVWYTSDSTNGVKFYGITVKGSTSESTTTEAVDAKVGEETQEKVAVKTEDDKTVITVENTETKLKESFTVTGSDTVSFTGLNKKKAKTVTVPATVSANGVTYKVTSISAGALKGCKKLTSVTIGKNVKIIGKNAFKNCKKLKKVTILSKKITKIHKTAFKGVNKNLRVKVAKAKLSKYRKMLRKAGVSSWKVTAK